MFKGDRSRVNAAISITALAVNPERLHLPVFSDRGEAPFRFLCAHAGRFASAAPTATSSVR